MLLFIGFVCCGAGGGGGGGGGLRVVAYSIGNAAFVTSADIPCHPILAAHVRLCPFRRVLASRY